MWVQPGGAATGNSSSSSSNTVAVDGTTSDAVACFPNLEAHKWHVIQYTMIIYNHNACLIARDCLHVDASLKSGQDCCCTVAAGGTISAAVACFPNLEASKWRVIQYIIIIYHYTACWIARDCLHVDASWKSGQNCCCCCCSVAHWQNRNVCANSAGADPAVIA